MEKRLLTIIIPGYNVADFIVDTLHEVFKQCESNFEVIYVDDASNDNTLMLIHQNFKNFILEKRLSVIESDVNCGPATARQKALDKVQTPYVTFLDADDHYASLDVLTNLINALEKYSPDLLMFKYVTDHGKVRIKKKCSLSTGVISAREAMCHKIKTSNPIWHYLWNKCYRMSLIRDNQIKFDDGERSAEDVEFNRKYLRIVDKIFFLDQYYYVYNCLNAHSLTSQKSTYTNEDLLLWWQREASQYNTLVNDSVALECESECQPFLAKKLADAAVRFDVLSRGVGGHIFEDVIQKDSLFPILKKYIWKSRFDYYLNSFVSHLKLVIKKIL